MNLPDCLPESLRGPATRITRIATGLSGAGVYTVATTDGKWAMGLALVREGIAA